MDLAPDSFSGVKTHYFIPPKKRPDIMKIPWSRKWQSTPVLLPGKFPGQTSLAGYSPWGHRESDVTEHPHPHPPIPTQELKQLNLGPFCGGKSFIKCNNL